ncbi:hypothetical protein FEKDPFPA_00082 [Pseudomonas phage PA4]|nr:hypothetical protein FEKDPFPA_00082 [Pseudomonas phage PA4]WKV23304.1 hypothetical protein APTCPA18_CDS54 [Pseudomonas phage APTC-PA18]
MKEQELEIPEYLKENAPGEIDYFGVMDEMAVEATDIGHRLLTLVDKASQLDGEILDLQKALAEKEEELKTLKRNTIPELLEELGQKTTTLADGRTVKVEPKAIISVKEENKSKFWKWLEDTDNDGIIKTKVLAEFGRGEMEDAKKAAEAIIEAGYDATINRDVHYQTLQSFGREYLEKGEELPDFIGVHEYKEAKITKPKVKKSKS